MRSHAKAATAGSTKRQARGLGRFVRGAGATRGSASSADGSGAPSRGRLTLALLAALALCGLVALTASSASGAVATEFVKAFGPDGTEASDFEEIRDVATDKQSGVVYVLDGFGASVSLYKFAADGTPLDWGGAAPYIQGNEITGLSPGFSPRLAVDPASHVVYLNEEHALRAFEQDGEAAEFTAGPGAGSDKIGGFEMTRGVAVDADGAIYVSDYVYPNPAGTVSVYAASGEPLTDFEVSGQLESLAVGPEGSVYLSNSAGTPNKVEKFEPSETPVTAATTFAAGKTFEQASSSAVKGIDVDQATGELYILENGGWIAKYDSDGAFVGYFGRTDKGGGSVEGRFPFNSSGLAVVPGGEEFQFYVGTNSTEGLESNRKKVEIFGEVINPGPPSIVSTSARDVASVSATLRAEINPNTFATAYRFEYGLGDCETSACASVPLADAPIGSGHHPVKVSQAVAGLEPGTTYHYRVVAESSEGVTEGPDRTFTTQVGGLGFQLADERAWEMVSPPRKYGGDIFIDGMILQAAADGNGLVFPSLGALDSDPEGSRAPERSVNLARRGAAGWHSRDISPPHTRAVQVIGNNEYKMFSPDLGRALLDAKDDTPLSPQASERTTYLRENTEPATYTPLVTGKEGFANVPPGTVFGGEEALGPLETMGANAALTHVVLRTRASLVAGGGAGGLYEWAEGQLRQINRLPAGEGGGVSPEGQLGSGQASVRNAVSADGSRVFWSAGSGFLTALYARDTVGEETVRLDVPQPGASGGGVANPLFQAASSDGEVVFFTDSRQLTADAGPDGPEKRDLYRCVVSFAAATPGCSSLTDVSAPLAGSGESAEIQEVTSAVTDDGSHVYFVARGVLDTAPNERGDAAVAGEPNLYLWREGEGVRFVATLSERDEPDWSISGRVSEITAAASPSGRYFTFMSERSLTGYDNRDAVSGEALEEVFRYDAVAERLVCVSCNPTGASPLGERQPAGQLSRDPRNFWSNRWVAAMLPEALKGEAQPGSSFHRPRYMLENGRVFFNAVDSLVPADSNGEWDAYQYEPLGVGDCNASTGGPSVVRSAGGCVSLLSSGTAEGEAAFLDAGTSGDDAFFITSARLSVTDEDSEPDVYDARVDGEPATLAPNTECLGEACQPAAQAPNDPTPASAGFKGQGNQKPNVRKRCAKGKRQVRRGGKARCVARKHHKRQNRAGKSGRAGR